MSRSGLLDTPPGLYRGLAGDRARERRVLGTHRRPTGARWCLTFDYEASSEREGLQHCEHTVASSDALHVALSEAPGVSVFDRTEAGVYVCAAPGPFVREIHASFADEVLTWAWHWASSGEQPREMSRAVCRRAHS